MTSNMSEPKSVHGSAPAIGSVDVTVVGAGILGLFNALQLAKRGFRVVLLDNLVGRKPSYKVGESMLLFTNAFLRTIGGIEPFIPSCFPKEGIWFAYGLEGAQRFDTACEWAGQADPHPPHYLYDRVKDDKWSRCMFLDAQLVRPEVERFMCDLVRKHPNITFYDAAKVKDIVLDEAGGPHSVVWQSQGSQEMSTTRTRWVVDCSGRNRMLAKKLGHAVEMSDGFQTTAAWGQFSGVTDELFGKRWEYTYRDGDTTSRDHFTVHLWGKGYWIWVIRLGGDRISVGVTWDQRTPPPGASTKEQFWNIIRRYPLLANVIAEERLLEFRTYRDVQHMTDTFVSERRYGMVGDAASIVDAYYSQGMSLGMVTSWHIANIIQRDLRENRLDLAYIRRVNRATMQDWHIMRNMVREKYSSAVEDSRFFTLSHVLDFVFLWAVSRTRADVTRWLVETEGDPARETPEMRALRARLEERLFFSQSPTWDWAAPESVQKLQAHLQARMADRARFRIEHGIKVPTIKTSLGLTTPFPPLWKMPFVEKDRVSDLSAPDVIKPAELGGPDPSWLRYLPLSIPERLRWVIRVRGPAVIALFGLMYSYDWADTAVQKVRVALRGGPRPAQVTRAATRDDNRPAPGARGGLHDGATAVEA